MSLKQYFFIVISILLSLDFSSANTSLRGSGICFTKNAGQVSDSKGNLRPDVWFTGDAGQIELFIRNTGVSYVLHKSDEIPEEAEKDKRLLEEINYYSHRIDFDFVNPNSTSSMEAHEEVEGYKNFYYPHCTNGIHNVKSYNRLIQKNIYNNIDVKYWGSKSNGLKYDIIVNPGGKPGDIKMKYSGTERIEIINGELQIKSSLGIMTEAIPKVYQEINGKIIDIKARYILNEDEISFDIANYNTSYPLIIDPWITYFGGASDDFSASIATDTQGDIILSGRTQSGNTLPILGAFQSTLAGQFDAFVAKMDANGTLKWSTFYGGTSMEVTAGVFADKNNDILFTGYTSSNNFPTGAAGGQVCFMNAFPGSCAFVVKLTSAGSRLWSTFYGSSTGYSEGDDITTDNNNNVILYGYTSATNNIATVGAFQQTYGGGFFFTDAFVAKFSSTGSLSWGTYIGGSLLEKGTGVCCDASNNIYLTGITNSTNFPVSAGAHQVTLGGRYDAFLFKFNPSGQRLWATFYGGADDEDGNAVQVDLNGDIYFGGLSVSPTAISTPGSYQPAKAVGPAWQADAFLAKFNSSGTRIWSTYLGGALSATPSDYITGIAIDNNNNVVVSGDTYCTDFPATSCAQQTSFVGSEDQFITSFDPNGNIICSGFLGLGNSASPNNETTNYGGGCIATFGGLVYSTATSVCNYPVTANAYQYTCGGSYEATISQLCITTCGLFKMTSNFSANKTTICKGDPVNFNLQTSSCNQNNTTYQWSFPGATPATSTAQNPTNIIYNSSGTFNVKVVIVTPCGKDSVIKNAYINVGTLSASTTSSPATCGHADGSATVTGTGGSGNYNYKWSTGQSTSTASGLASGIYTATVNDGTCLITTSVNVTQTGGGIIINSINSGNIGCSGNNGWAKVSVAGVNNYTYLWSNGATGSSISNLSAGNYSIVVSDQNGCTVSGQVNILQSTPMVVNIDSIDATCVTLGSATISITGGTSPFTYNWNNGQSASAVSNLSSGVYSVTITDASLCTTIATTTIHQPSAIIINTITATDVSCYGGNDGAVSVSASGGNGTYTYSWSNGNTNASLNNLSTGNYNITVSDNSGCAATGTVTIAEPAKLNMTLSPATAICIGQSIILNASASGGTPAYNYSWNNGNTNSMINISPTINTSYTVRITDNNGCTIDSVVLITAKPLPIVSFTSDSIDGCSPLCVTFTNTTPNTSSLSWDFGNGNSSTLQQANNCFTNPGQYGITLTVLDNNGCSNTLTQNNYITVHPNPIAAFIMNPNPANTNSPIKFIDNSTGATSWNWNFADAIPPISSQQNPTCAYTYGGEYKVQLIVQNEFGCTDSIEETIRVMPEFSFYCPNTFTPNDDKVNDIFIPIAEEIEANNYHLYIYDRWGDLIFETNDPLKGWDGKANDGKLIAQEDTYVWKLSFKDSAGNQRRYLGNINLIR